MLFFSKKIAIILIACFLYNVVQGQTKNLSYTIEYAPNFSDKTNGPFYEDIKLSHKALVRIEFGMNKKIMPTIGVAFLNTGKRSGSLQLSGRPAGELSTIIHRHNYLIIPVGVKFKSNSVYFLPEIGFGFNVSHKVVLIHHLLNGETLKETLEFSSGSPELNKFTTPVMLSIGNDFKMGNANFTLGVNAYYDLNNIVNLSHLSRHYYGIGILMGVRI